MGVHDEAPPQWWRAEGQEETRFRDYFKILAEFLFRHTTGLDLTLSEARILKEAMTCSAVSVSAVSRVMKSMKAWKVTTPVLLGSTSVMMRANSTSPCQETANEVQDTHLLLCSVIGVCWGPGRGLAKYEHLLFFFFKVWWRGLLQNRAQLQREKPLKITPK